MKVGDVLSGRFEIGTLAGEGGMGRVYRAVDRTSGAFVAIKVLLVDVDEHGARFEREATILEKLSHENIVRHVGRGSTAAGQPFIVMEWLDGEDLAKRIARSKLTLEETFAIITGAARALAAAHDRRVIHRDVKPSNIFLVDRQPNRVKVLDFGIARSNSDATLTVTGSFLGTPAYTAPERAKEGQILDPRADVYSLGCVFYECLSGQSAFASGHWAAVLSKVLMTDPPRLRDVRPELPAAVEDLVRRMMAKDPNERLRDCVAVLEALELLKEDRSRDAGSMNALTNSERRSASVLLVRGAVGQTTRDDTLSGADADVAHSFRRAIATWGGRLEVVSDELAVVSMGGEQLATDDAARAARCALWLREHVGVEAIALVTWNESAGLETKAGAAVDQAARMLPTRLASAQSCSIAIDDTTARLLDGRFDVRETSTGLLLYGERANVLDARLLLGKPTPCIGRDRELSSLSHLHVDCIDEQAARAALLMGTAGMGKSRIVHEFLGRVRSHDVPTSVWLARGDAMRTGSTLGVLAQIVRAACAIHSNESVAGCQAKLSAQVARHVKVHEQRRVTEFLSEMIGVHSLDSSVLLRSALRHAQTMADEMCRAWVDFLRAEAAAQPVLLVLEDLHWADETTIRFIDAAFDELPDLPWMVVATARPALRERFPKLWATRHVQEIDLQPLGKKACERLARQVLGDRISAQALERIISRASGNAFYIEELIRHAAEQDAEELPSTVLAMVQSRLAMLDEQARRVLRAAAILGESFSATAISVLLGASERTLTIGRMLDGLVEQEVLVRRVVGRLSNEHEYAFRHVLLREGAYATLTDRDRVLGHKLAGEWLQTCGEADGALLAMHFERAGEGDIAAMHYLRAAELALDGGDHAMAMRFAGCGAELTHQDETVAGLRSIEAVAGLWSGQLARALSAANEALRLASSGSKHEGHALHAALLSAMYMRQTQALEEPMRRLFQTQPTSEALAAIAPAFHSLIGACIWTAQPAEAQRCMKRFEEITAAAEDADPMVVAHMEMTRALISLHVERDFWAYFNHSERAVEQCTQTGARRELFLARVNLATGAWLLGRLDQAEQEFSRVIASGAPLDALFARYNRARMFFDQGRVDEAEQLVDECSKQFDAMGEMMIRVDSRTCWMEIQLKKGDISAADAEAARLGPVDSAPYVSQYYYAVLAQIRLAQGRPREASEIAERTYAQSVACGMGYCVSHPKLLNVRAEALFACGDIEATRQAVRIAQADLMARADKIPDPATRKAFLESFGDHRRTLELARDWL